MTCGKKARRCWFHGSTGDISPLYAQRDCQELLICDAQVYAKLESYEEDWAGGRVQGWEDRGEGPAANGATAAIDLEAFEAVEELETLGAPMALLCI